MNGQLWNYLIGTCNGDASYLINPADTLVVRKILPPSTPPPSSSTTTPPLPPQMAGEGAADVTGPVPDLEFGFADRAFARAAHYAAGILGGAPASALRIKEKAVGVGWDAGLRSIAPRRRHCVLGN
jgi:hypothetical protein